MSKVLVPQEQIHLELTFKNVLVWCIPLLDIPKMSRLVDNGVSVKINEKRDTFYIRIKRDKINLLEGLLKGNPNLVGDLFYDQYKIFLFKVPNSLKNTIDLMLKGKYSQISAEHKNKIKQKSHYADSVIIHRDIEGNQINERTFEIELNKINNIISEYGYNYKNVPLPTINIHYNHFSLALTNGIKERIIVAQSLGVKVDDLPDDIYEYPYPDLNIETEL